MSTFFSNGGKALFLLFRWYITISLFAFVSQATFILVANTPGLSQFMADNPNVHGSVMGSLTILGIGAAIWWLKYRK